MKTVKLKGMRVVPQRDGHSCGYCAASTIYRFYGMDPIKLGLRGQLGVDNSAIPYAMPLRDKIDAWLESVGWDSKGLLPPDLMATLYMHGFDLKVCSGSYFNSYAPKLLKHLKSGHPALALADGVVHWLVVAGLGDEGVHIIDSAGFCDPDENSRQRYVLEHEEFSELVSGTILVSRRKSARLRKMTYRDLYREHLRGAVFAAACMGRAIPRWVKMYPRGGDADKNG